MEINTQKLHAKILDKTFKLRLTEAGSLEGYPTHFNNNSDGLGKMR